MPSVSAAAGTICWIRVNAVISVGAMPSPTTKMITASAGTFDGEQEQPREHPEDHGLQAEPLQHGRAPVPRAVDEAADRAAGGESGQYQPAPSRGTALAAERDDGDLGAREHPAHGRASRYQERHAGIAQRAGVTRRAGRVGRRLG